MIVLVPASVESLRKMFKVFEEVDQGSGWMARTAFESGLGCAASVVLSTAMLPLACRIRHCKLAGVELIDAE